MLEVIKEATRCRQLERECLPMCKQISYILTFSFISKYRKPGTTEFLHPRIVYLSEENNPSFCCEEGMVAKIDIGSPNSPGVDTHTLRYDVVVDDIELVFKITNLTTHRLEGITVRYLND